MSETCRTCRFWREKVKRGAVTSYEQCCRYPNAIARMSTEWCGEYSPTPTDPARKLEE